MITLKLEGMEELNSQIKKLESEYGKQLKGAHITAGKLVEGSAKKSIQEKSPGNMTVRYRNGGNSYEHQSAAKGDAPNTDTGRLVNSVNTEPAPGGAFVGTTLQYGLYLEIGDHPWLIPALQSRKGDIASVYISAINKSIDEVAKSAKL